MATSLSGAAAVVALLIVGLGQTPARAQISATPNCAVPFSQAEINMCAQAELQGADAEMSAVYELLLAQMQDQDRSYAENGPEFVGAEILLRESQEAWSRSRGDLCAIEGLTFRGGSMRPAAVASCMATLALSRAEELRWLLR